MNRDRHIVSDTGPLITLERLTDGYSFIRLLYDKILIPRAVLDELRSSQLPNALAYLSHYGIADLLEIVDVQGVPTFAEAELLDAGEVESIQLAIGSGLPLLIEEEAGRRAARELGVQISGIAGQILKALRRDLITAAEARGKLRELFEKGRVSRRIYEGLLEAIA